MGRVLIMWDVGSCGAGLGEGVGEKSREAEVALAVETRQRKGEGEPAFFEAHAWGQRAGLSLTGGREMCTHAVRALCSTFLC